MKPARFHSDAEAELAQQAKYYEDQCPGLGERFIREVEIALELACACPGIGAPYKHGSRRVFPKKFPHSIVYLELTAELVVLAIAPFPRRPG